MMTYTNVQNVTSLDNRYAVRTLYAIAHNGKTQDRPNLIFCFLAATAFWTSVHQFSQPEALDDFLVNTITEQMRGDCAGIVRARMQRFCRNYWPEILDCSRKFSPEALKNAALSGYPRSIRNKQKTPVSVALLASRLLQPQPGDSVLDQGAGMGVFLGVLSSKYHVKQAVGIEMEADICWMAGVRSLLLGKSFVIVQDDVLRNGGYPWLCSDKVFSDCPVERYRRQDQEHTLREARYRKYGDLFEKTSVRLSEWIFLLSAITFQKEGGRTVVAVRSGMLSRDMRGERTIREALAKEGRIEAVITLPSRLYDRISDTVNLIVCSQNNTAIQMIDASKLGTATRWETSLQDSDIETIINALHEETEISRSVSIEELGRHSYNWTPAFYLAMDKIHVTNGVKLGTVAKIERGIMLLQNESEELRSDEPEGYQYLMAQDIQNNQIAVNLPWLKPAETVNKRLRFLEKGDLLITRTAPFKLAVVPDIGDRKILANGNIYIIKLNQEKVLPLYAMIYLSSPQGSFVLNALTQGGALRSLPIKDLQNIEIPLRPMHEQAEIAEQYRSLLYQLNDIQEKIKGLQETIR